MGSSYHTKKGACFGETYLNVYARIPTSSYKIQLSIRWHYSEKIISQVMCVCK